MRREAGGTILLVMEDKRPPVPQASEAPLHLRPTWAPACWLDHAGASIRGPVRPDNQDFWLAEPELGLWLLADGIASRGKGAVASSLALHTIAAEVRRGLDDGLAATPAGDSEDGVKLLVSAFAAAHLRLLDASRDEAPRAAMGTTVVGLSLRESEAILVHLGDSRCYSYSRGSAVQVTTDHNVATALKSPNLSELARQTMQGLNPRAITRALGCGNLAPPRPSVVRLNSRCSELLVLTSDGVHDPLGPQGIALVLDSTGGTLLARAQALVEAAVAAGGKDNATVVLVRPPASGRQRAPLGTTARL